MFEASELQALCREAKTSIQFEALSGDLVRAQERLAQDPDLLQFQKTRFASELSDAQNLLKRRLEDPHELLRALTSQQLSEEAVREYWIKAVYEQSDAAVDRTLVDAVRQVRSDTQYDGTDTQRKALNQAERAELFACWAVNLSRTRQSCVYHIRQLLSLPVDIKLEEFEAPIARLKAALKKIGERQHLSSVARFEESLAGMEGVVNGVSERLDEATSYVIQVILLTTRTPLIEDADLASHPEFLERLDGLEERFSHVRFRNPRIVYEEDYEPRLQRLRAAAQSSTEFSGVRATLKEIDDRATAVAFTRVGERGRNGLNRTYQKLVHTEVGHLREIVAIREVDARALFLEVEGIAAAVAEVDARPIVARNTTRGLRQGLERTGAWADKAIPAIEKAAGDAASLLRTKEPSEIPRIAIMLRSVFDTLTASSEVNEAIGALQKMVSALEAGSVLPAKFPWAESQVILAHAEAMLQVLTSRMRARIGELRATIAILETSIEGRYQAYVENIVVQLERFQVEVATAEDLREASDELKEISHQLLDKELGLTKAHLARLQPVTHAAQQALRSRLADKEEIDAQFAKLEIRVRDAVRRIGRFNEIDTIDRDAQSLGWRIGNVPAEVRLAFQPRIRSLYAGVRSLRAKREQIVREREANQAAAREALRAIITEAAQAAQANPGNPAAWEELVDAQRQLRETYILTVTQRQPLQGLLDQAFQKVKSIRSAFAQKATIVFCRYTDVIQNIQEDLEASDPRPTRAEAFDAIERMKPIRMQLRSERELLRVHRNELNESLRAISNTIDEILDKASQEMERQLVLMQRRIEVLAVAISEAIDPADISKCVRAHRELSSELLAATLPIEGRRACRARMGVLFDQLTEKREATGRNRFNASNIQITLSRLEAQGFFQWMKGAPAIS